MFSLAVEIQVEALAAGKSPVEPSHVQEHSVGQSMVLITLKLWVQPPFGPFT